MPTQIPLIAPRLFTYLPCIHGKYKEGREWQIGIWQIETEIKMNGTLGAVENPAASRAAENKAAAKKATVVDRKAAVHKVEAVAVPAVAIGKLEIRRAGFARPSLTRVLTGCRLAQKFVKGVE